LLVAMQILVLFICSDEEQITTWLHPDTGQPAMTGFQRTLGMLKVYFKKWFAVTSRIFVFG